MAALNSEWLAQTLGILAFLISLVGYLSTDDRRMKIMLTSGTAILSLHFVLFGAWLAALSLVMNTGRTWLSLHRRGMPIFFMVATAQLAVSIPLVSELRDVFPVIGSIVGSYGLLCLSGTGLRAALLVTTSFWFVNNLLWGSVGGLMLDAMNAVAHVYAILRIRRAIARQHSANGTV